MGSKRRRGNTYQFRYKGRSTTWKVPEGMTVKKAEKQAAKELAAFEELVDRGVNIKKMTFSQLAEKYLADCEGECKPTTIEAHMYRIKRINQSIGDIEVKTLTKQHIRNFIQELEKPYFTKSGIEKKYSAATIADYYKTISCVLTYGCEQDYLERNICAEKGIKRPSMASGKVKTIPVDTLAEYIEMLKDMKPKYEVFFHLLLNTGARKGEILALKWSDVNFDDCSVSINENVQYLTGKGIFYTTPKTSASKRTIQVPEYVIDMLRSWKTEQSKQRLAAGQLWGCNPKDTSEHFCDNHSECNKSTRGFCNKNCRMYKMADRIFTTDFGTQMHPDTPLDEIQKNAKKRGLEHITLHALRHTAASIFIEDGVSVTDISAFLGHSSPAVTTSIYLHELEEREKAKTVSTNVMEYIRKAE